MSAPQRFGFFVFGALLAASILGASNTALAFDQPAYGAMLRLSGRLSFILWLTTFIASPLLTLSRSELAKFLLRYRRGIGLMFAGSHFVHAILLISLALKIPGFQFSRLALIGGSIGFAFIAAMAVTSFEGPARAIGSKAWRRLHKLGTWYISGIFALDFVVTPILQGKQFDLAYYPFALMILAAYAMRAFAALRVSSIETAAAHPLEHR
jgi:methionine sulfoxide reductase heme-binding subunit